MTGPAVLPKPCTLLAMLAALAAGRSCAGENWIDWRTAGPFVCRADFPLDGMQGLFEDLAQLQHDLGRLLRLPPPKEPIHLYLFADQSGYRRFLARYLPEVPYRRALYVKHGGVGKVLAYKSPQFAVDLRHECTHALLHSVLPMVPLWLDEGLAEYFELSPIERAFDNPYLPVVRWRARLAMVSRLEDLEKKTELAEMGGTEYREAWAWTHFMLHSGPEAHDELVRFLLDLQNRNPPGRLSARLRRRLPDLERRFAAHFRAWRR